MATANITPLAETDGVTYCTSVPLTATEADLGDSLITPRPVAIVYGQAILAIVQFAINGIINLNKSYVVMQTDLGDGVWIDVAWAFYSQQQAPETHVLFGGGLGGGAGAFRKSRDANSLPTPQADGSNALPLGGRVRFSGGAILASGSSSAPGVSTVVSVTIKYKLLAPR